MTALALSLCKYKIANRNVVCRMKDTKSCETGERQMSQIAYAHGLNLKYSGSGFRVQVSEKPKQRKVHRPTQS